MVAQKRTVAIIQARLSSSRLPGKVMKDLCGKTLLERVLQRTKAATKLDDIWLATSTDDSDDIIEFVGKENGINVFRGDLEDVLRRYCEAAKKSKADIIVRVCADNPLIEPRFIDISVEAILREELDYVAFKNVPLGSGVEPLSKEALFYSEQLAKDQSEREHVTLFIRNHPEIFKIKFLESPNRLLARPDISITLDTLEDYVDLYKVFRHFRNKKDIMLEDVIAFIDHNKKNFLSLTRTDLT